jgi:hypothetical protein
VDSPTCSHGRTYNGGSFHVVADPHNMNTAKNLNIYSDCIKHNIKIIQYGLGIKCPHAERLKVEEKFV